MTDAVEGLDYLTVDDLLSIAEGVIDGVGVRDLGLLASAAARPQTTVMGRYAYATMPAQAAALMHSLARNHPLVDGNKRLAWAATRVFLLLAGHDIVCGVETAELLVRSVAVGELEVAQLAVEIGRHLT